MAMLPDPRSYATGPSRHPLLELAAAGQAGESGADVRLEREISACIRRGDDAAIFEALRRAPSCPIYRRLWESVCAAVDRTPPDAPVVARLFAIPIVFVTGAGRGSVLPGVIPDIAEITGLLYRHRAVGATRNFGLGNALCGVESLDGLGPSEVYRWNSRWDESGPTRKFPPQPIRVEPGREQTHLRFLVGAGIARSDAPSFIETAAHVGSWGIAVTRALVRQLAQPGVELLAIPRAPVSLLRAAYAGRASQIETAFHLFVSNTLRAFRLSVGDPVVVISAHRYRGGGGEIRVSMSSVLDDTLLEGFRWPLHPLDDLEQIVAAMSGLLRECRVTEVRFVGHVLEDDSAGHPAFVRAADLDSGSLPPRVV
jgi:hypothetical protein